MDSLPNIQNIYGMMFAGDLLVQKLGRHAIFLVGESRIGKSTLFNLLQGFQLEAIQSDEEDYYKCVQTKSGVEAKSGFESVTLLPNLAPQLMFNESRIDVNLVDMAGYGDHGRSYVGVFGVSYMLKRIL